MTRRELLQTGSALALAPAAAAQTAPPEAQNPDWMQAARDQAKRNSELMAKVELPMSTEPAFFFKP